MMMRRIARAVPTPTPSLPPPAAADVDPNQLIVDIGPLTARFLCDQDRSILDRIAFTRCEKKCVLLAARGNPIPHDEFGFVNRLCHGEDLEIGHGKIADRIEINHLSVREKEGVDRAVWYGGEANDLSGGVGTERATLGTAQSAEIGHAPIGIKECVVASAAANIGAAGGSREAVDISFAGRPAQRSEVEHCRISIKKCVNGTVFGLGKAHNLAGGINRTGGAGSSTKCPQIDDVIT